MKHISEVTMDLFAQTKMISLFTEVTKEHKASFMKSYREICGDITITEEMKPILNNLCKYFLGIKGEYDLNKGIYLFGAYGVGKTTMMLSFRRWLADFFTRSGNGFTSTSIEEIIDTYKRDGNVEPFTLNRGEYGYAYPRHLLINEFGKEIKDKIYGTEAEQIINSLMMRRYEIFQQFGKVTHVTSNYEPKTYDKALNDRYVEMFTLVELKGKSLRK